MAYGSLVVPRAVAAAAVRQLATVDYTVANRVTDDVATIVQWAFAHDVPWVANVAMHTLQRFDDVGSVLIAIVVYVVAHVR